MYYASGRGRLKGYSLCYKAELDTCLLKNFFSDVPFLQGKQNAMSAFGSFTLLTHLVIILCPAVRRKFFQGLSSSQ
jgi:hypothetical protein